MISTKADQDQVVDLLERDGEQKLSQAAMSALSRLMETLQGQRGPMPDSIPGILSDLEQAQTPGKKIQILFNYKATMGFLATGLQQDEKSESKPGMKTIFKTLANFTAAEWKALIDESNQKDEEPLLEFKDDSGKTHQIKQVTNQLYMYAQQATFEELTSVPDLLHALLQIDSGDSAVLNSNFFQALRNKSGYSHSAMVGFFCQAIECSYGPPLLCYIGKEFSFIDVFGERPWAEVISTFKGVCDSLSHEDYHGLKHTLLHLLYNCFFINGIIEFDIIQVIMKVYGNKSNKKSIDFILKQFFDRINKSAIGTKPHIDDGQRFLYWTAFVVLRSLLASKTTLLSTADKQAIQKVLVLHGQYFSDNTHPKEQRRLRTLYRKYQLQKTFGFQFAHIEEQKVDEPGETARQRKQRRKKAKKRQRQQQKQKHKTQPTSARKKRTSPTVIVPVNAADLYVLSQEQKETKKAAPVTVNSSAKKKKKKRRRGASSRNAVIRQQQAAAAAAEEHQDGDSDVAGSIASSILSLACSEGSDITEQSVDSKLNSSGILSPACSEGFDTVRLSDDSKFDSPSVSSPASPVAVVTTFKRVQSSLTDIVSEQERAVHLQAAMRQQQAAATEEHQDKDSDVASSVASLVLSPVYSERSDTTDQSVDSKPYSPEVSSTASPVVAVTTLMRAQPSLTDIIREQERVERFQTDANQLLASFTKKIETFYQIYLGIGSIRINAWAKKQGILKFEINAIGEMFKSLKKSGLALKYSKQKVIVEGDACTHSQKIQNFIIAWNDMLQALVFQFGDLIKDSFEAKQEPANLALRTRLERVQTILLCHFMSSNLAVPQEHEELRQIAMTLNAIENDGIYESSTQVFANMTQLDEKQEVTGEAAKRVDYDIVLVCQRSFDTLEHEAHAILSAFPRSIHFMVYKGGGQFKVFDESICLQAEVKGCGRTVDVKVVFSPIIAADCRKRVTTIASVYRDLKTNRCLVHPYTWYDLRNGLIRLANPKLDLNDHTNNALTFILRQGIKFFGRLQYEDELSARLNALLNIGPPAADAKPSAETKSLSELSNSRKIFLWGRTLNTITNWQNTRPLHFVSLLESLQVIQKIMLLQSLSYFHYDKIVCSFIEDKSNIQTLANGNDLFMAVYYACKLLPTALIYHGESNIGSMLSCIGMSKSQIQLTQHVLMFFSDDSYIDNKYQQNQTKLISIKARLGVTPTLVELARTRGTGTQTTFAPLRFFDRSTPTPEPLESAVIVPHSDREYWQAQPM